MYLRCLVLQRNSESEIFKFRKYRKDQPSHIWEDFFFNFFEMLLGRNLEHYWNDLWSISYGTGIYVGKSGTGIEFIILTFFTLISRAFPSKINEKSCKNPLCDDIIIDFNGTCRTQL